MRSFVKVFLIACIIIFLVQYYAIECVEKPDDQNFLDLMEEINKDRRYAMIYTTKKDSLSFEVTYGAAPSRDRKLFLENYAQKDKWVMVKQNNDRDIYFLLPPKTLESTDITDFAKKHLNKSKDLYDEIKKNLESLRKKHQKQFWVYTHGLGERNYFHVRYEAKDTRTLSLNIK